METATSESRPLIRAHGSVRADAPTAVGRLASLLPGIVAALVIVALGFADGGYFATAWGPVTLVFLAFAVAALLVRPATPTLGLLALAMPALLGAARDLDSRLLGLGLAERSCCRRRSAR